MSHPRRLYAQTTRICSTARRGGDSVRSGREQDEEVPEQAPGDRRPGKLLRRRRSESYQLRGRIGRSSWPDPGAEPNHHRTDVRAVSDSTNQVARHAAGNYGARIFAFGSVTRIDSGWARGLAALLRSQGHLNV